jgi:hypothetical protein
MANEKRLIDADALNQRIKERLKNELIIGWLCSIVDEAPTVDAVEVVHGRWEFRRSEKYSWCTDAVCTACENILDTHIENDLEYRQEAVKKKLLYCPNGGAKLDGGQGNGSKQQS